MKNIIILILLVYFKFTFGQPEAKLDNPNFSIDSYLIQFEDCDSVSFDNYFVDQKIIDSISENYSNWHERAEAIEKYQIEKDKVKVTIDDFTRHIILNNGTEITLTPNEMTDEGGFTYEKSFMDETFQLYRVQWGEGNDYLLLNTNTGEKIRTIGRVYFSPSYKHMISMNQDVDAGYSSNGFQLFQLNKNNEFKLLWQYDPLWAPEKIKWISDSELVVFGFINDEQNKWKYKEFYKMIIINAP